MTSINIRNVSVHRHGSGSMDCSIAWETTEARYHVWLDMPERKPRAVIYKNPLKINGQPRKPTEFGYFDCRRLQLRSVVNLHMVREAMRIADAADLWSKAERDLVEAERIADAATAAANLASDREDMTAILRRFVARGMLAQEAAQSIIDAVNPEGTDAKA